MASTTATESIRASVLHGAKDLRLETRSIDPPGEGEVQVAVRATGICGSDLHYYDHFRNGDILVREPLSLGHESSGEVVAVGPGVSSLKVGDRVALEVGLPCGACDRCAEGRYNICAKMRFRSSAKSFPHAQGTLQDRINHPADWCHPLPWAMPWSTSALLEPLGVAIHAARRAALSPSASVLVFGAGAVGLLVAGVCKVYGARTVIIADVDPGRVKFAVDNKFADGSFVVPMGPRSSTAEEALQAAKDLAQKISECKNQRGKPVGEVDAVFECTGVSSCLQTAIYATRAGGKVMLIGMGNPIQTLPVSAAALREVDLCGVFRYANTYSEGIRILSSTDPNAPNFSSLITHEFSGLVAVETAFKMAGRKQDDDGKLVIKVMVANE